jgi:hypothetical protein
MADLKFYQVLENNLSLKYKLLIESIEFEVRVMLLQFLELTRGQIEDRDTLNNLLAGSLFEFNLEHKHDEKKKITDFLIFASVKGPINFTEKIYAENYAANKILETMSVQN